MIHSGPQHLELISKNSKLHCERKLGTFQEFFLPMIITGQALDIQSSKLGHWILIFL